MSDLKQTDAVLAFAGDKETYDIFKSLDLRRYNFSLDVHQANVKSAISYLQFNRSPKILIVDIAGSEFPITDMKSLAEVCEPGVQVIAIGDRNDVGIFRELVEIGVHDYIAKPLNASLILKSLDNLLGKKSEQKKQGAGFSHEGQLISFIGARGGVGSSMVAANTAYALGHGQFKRVCLLDMDFHHGVLGQLFSMESPGGFRELLETPNRIDEGILGRATSKVSEYLSILSSPVPVDQKFPYPRAAIENLVPLLSKHYHYTLLDFPRYYHEDHYDLMSDSDVIVITFDFTLLSVKDVVSLLRIFGANEKTRIILVANRQGEYKKGELSQKMFEESIHREIDVVVPFDAVKPLQMMNEGVPVASEKGVMSDAVYEIVKCMTGRSAQAAPSKGGLLGSLFGGSAASNK